jgi:hypothetical protein
MTWRGHWNPQVERKERNEIHVGICNSSVANEYLEVGGSLYLGTNYVLVWYVGTDQHNANPTSLPLYITIQAMGVTCYRHEIREIKGLDHYFKTAYLPSGIILFSVNKEVENTLSSIVKEHTQRRCTCELRVMFSFGARQSTWRRLRPNLPGLLSHFAFYRPISLTVCRTSNPFLGSINVLPLFIQRSETLIQRQRQEQQHAQMLQVHARPGVREPSVREPVVNSSDQKQDTKLVSAADTQHAQNADKEDDKQNEPVTAQDFMNTMIQCKVCLDAMITMVLKPCHHAICCQPCSLMVQTCPICRCNITGREKIFFA